MRKLILILLCIFLGCLKTIKSGFDISAPGGLLFGFALFNFTSQSSSGTYTIGGSITGISSGTLTLSYNSQANTIDLSAKTYKISAAKGAYTLSLSSVPTGYICTVSNSSGTLSADITNADITCSAVTVSSVYTGNSNWNDYVKNDGSSLLNATNTACTGSETGGYRACIHGGEIRKITLTGLSSCTGITASDALKAFNWICKTDSSGTATVFSTGLNSGKYLSDLMDFSAPGFLKNSVTVSKDGVAYITTVSSVWWTNPVVLNSGSISTASQIHLFNTDPGTTLPFNAHKAAIVFKTSGPVVLGSSGCATNPAIGTNTKNFLWIEGNYISPSGLNTSGLAVTGTFNVIKNFRIQNFNSGSCNSPGILLTGQNNFFEDIVIGNGASTGANGITVSAASYNFFKNVTIFNMTNAGILLSGSSQNNTFQNITVMNTAGYGFLTSGTALNTSLMNVSVINGNNDGIRIGGANNSLLMNALTVNNAGATNGGLVLNSTGLTVQNAGSSGNGTSNIVLTGASAYITGVLKGGGCSNIGSTGITASCAVQGTSDFNFTTGLTGIAFTVNSGLIFLDKVTSDDSKNQSDATGSSSYGTITDWTHFDSFYRGWGLDGSFPSTGVRGAGSGVSVMRIYDWSLKSSDSILRNVTPCPTDISDLNGADTNALTHSFSTGTVTMLRNAVEIVGDGIGDDDGFCENDEACIYTPNIGVYQGHGNLILSSQASSTTKTCPDPGSADTVKNVTLYKYENNGY